MAKSTPDATQGQCAVLEQLASELHITSRTLRRKLCDDGSRFQEIKADIRLDQAIHYLSQPDIPIFRISSLLGFTEPTAFTRAFKKWTGYYRSSL